MARALTELLHDFLHQFTVQSNYSEYCRLVLGSLPSDVLKELFVVLTQADGSLWQPADGIQIPVFLVTHDPRTDGSGPSRECNWDYALAIRNSFPSFLLLVDPLVWDDRTYSIVNATDTIGLPLPPVRAGNVPVLRNWSSFYANVVEMAAARIGIETSVVESAIRKTLRDLPSLDPTQQHKLPWEVLQRIAELAASRAVTHNDLARVCGLPSLENGEGNFRRNRRTLERLARFLDDTGIEGGMEELKGTSRGSSIGTELDTLGNHLRESAGSASAVVRAPSFYYFPPGPEPNWWGTVDVEAIDEMLAEVGHAVDPDRISVACTNPLNPSPPSGEPFLVQDEVIIEARHPEGTFQAPRILRRLGRQNPVELASASAFQGPFTHEDFSIPSHSAPVTYLADAHGAALASVQVISMEKYVPGGFVSCSGTSTRKVSRPRRNRVAAPWEQQIFLRSGGLKVLRVFCTSTVTKVEITEPSEFRTDCPVNGGTAELQLDLDEDIEIALDLSGPDNRVVSAFNLTISIDEEQVETVPSQFHALVQAHQEIKNSTSAARSRDSWLRGVEGELLNRNSSWRPILATPGWADLRPRLTDTRLLGSLRPHVDPRPDLNPPANFIEARGRVVNWLCSAEVPIPEADLANEEVTQIATDYMRAYREWSERAQEEACWLDTISILEPEVEQYGNQAVAAPEPVAVLVSPLHPIRFGWHVAAQRVLSSGLDAPCPLAGLLDPHRCPEVLPLAFTRSGGDPRWKSYVSISCQDAMWGLYWDSGRLRDMSQHEAVTELVVAGVVPRGVQSGFTASQARKMLEEMSHVLPTRAILRIGIVGSGQGSTSCTEGLITWSREPYSKGREELAGPRSIEIYDSREYVSQPSSEEISSLADVTGHRVRWFSTSQATPAKDLVIVDHLGLASPVGEVHPWKSPTMEGGLIRSRIRLDRNDAELVIESRGGNTVQSEDTLLDELGQTIGQVEYLAENLGATSHIAFMPNRQVLSGELEAARFLAVSSTEIDPACFARSTPQAGGFLWDYELPHAVGPGEQRGGFYLLARPPEAIKRAVLRATEVVTQSSIDLDALLVETSRRGIPILKRLAAGGSLARGELGMLLAVRLLQDSFRGPGRTVRLPVFEDSTLRMVLPVDPYVSPLERLRQGLHKANPELREATRPDLLLACIQIDGEEGTRVRLVPLEVKFREGIMPAGDKTGSLAQAHSLGKVIHHLLRATPLNDLWGMCGLGFLSEILDHGFRVYGDPSVNGKSPEQWVDIHQACLADIASGRVTISIAEEGRLLVFDESPNSYLDDVDGDGFAETLVVSREDGRALLEDGLPLSHCVDQVASLLDICGTNPEVAASTGSTAAAGHPGEALSESDLGTSEASNQAIPHQRASEESTVVPRSAREQVARAFSGFIGNQAAIDTLKRGVLRALLSDPPQLPASYLLTGNPSTGKTELARRVARSLALPFVSLDGRGLVSREQLFELMDGRLRDSGQLPTRVGTQYQRPELEYPPLVVFVDEVHLVPRPVQESLLTALEPKDRSVLLSDRVARLPQVTFLFATTRPSDVDMAFRTRCTEIPLQDYTEEEVAVIVGLEQPDWPEPLRRRIARYGRFVPRIALEFARELAGEALVSEHQDRDLADHLDEVRRTRLVDENGLGRIDIEYLELLDREGRPLGERNILTMLGNIDKDRFLEEVEPLLVARMKLVRRTGRGREITPEGRRYLIEMRKTRSSSSTGRTK